MNRPSETTIGHQVRVAGAVKRYGPCTALDGVDFEVPPGHFLVLLGPSGSGKSTLIRSLAGIERLDAGEIRLGGQLVTARNRHLPPERRNLAMVFQDYALWPHLTVFGNVCYALRRRHLDTTAARDRVHSALARVGLGDHGSRYPHELSGGQQQRVALARAVVAQPALLLFDEPLSNLDADLRERLRLEIATLTRDSGATAVYITHDQSEAFALADTVGVLDHGTLVQLATPEEIYRRPATPFVARFTGVAAELLGRVEHASTETAVVKAGELLIRARAIGAVAAGDTAHVLIRPAATRLIDLVATGPETTPNTLRGTVVDVAYRGRGYDHVIAAGPHRIAAVHDAHPHRRGDEVTVMLDTDHVLAYADTGYSADLTTVTIGKALSSGATSNRTDKG